MNPKGVREEFREIKRDHEIEEERERARGRENEIERG